MAEIALTGDRTGGAGTHALVVGVSHYPYVDGPEPTESGTRSGLASLSSAARSASHVAAWLLEEHRNDAPLASLRVLLSPAAEEELAPSIASRLDGPCPATLAAFRQELLALRAACQGHPENAAFVYVVGHGVQLTKAGATVLLEDFAGPNQATQLEGAVDVVGCHAGFNGDGYAATQCWFVDACRQRPAVASRFDELSGAFKLDVPLGTVASSPLFLASSPRELAFARRGEQTLFSLALLEALRGGAATGPDDLCDSWHVSVSRLLPELQRSVKRLAGADGADQQVDIGGRPLEAVIQRFEEPPDVRLRLDLEPAAAAASAKASLFHRGAPVFDAAGDWPVERTVKAGLYALSVDVGEPYRPIDKEPIDVTPPERRWPVEVS